jgi:hypothetical protein
MVDGFVTGVEAGQDWLKRADEYDALLESRGDEPSASARLTMMARWATDNPKAALDWFAENTAFKELWEEDVGIPPQPPPELPGLEKLPEEMLVKFELLREARKGDWMYGEAIPRLVDQLVASGEGDLAALVMAECVWGGVSDFRFFPQIRAFPDAEVRAALFLQAANSIQPRDKADPFGGGTEKLERQPWIESVRDLAKVIDLPEEVKAEAEAHLREVEAGELKFIADEARRERDPSDPFGP